MSAHRRKPISKKRAKKEQRQTVYRLGRPENISNDLPRKQRKAIWFATRQLKECMRQGCPIAKANPSEKPLKCSSACAMAQFKLERTFPRRLRRFLERQGGPVWFTTIIYPHLDMTPEKLVTFDRSGIWQHLRRGLLRAQSMVGTRIIAAARLDFKEVISSKGKMAISLNVHVLSVGGTSEAYLQCLKPCQRQDARRVARLVLTKPLNDISGAIYLLKYEVEGRPNSKSTSLLKQPPRKAAKLAVDLWSCTRTIEQSIFKFGWRLAGNRMRLT